MIECQTHTSFVAGLVQLNKELMHIGSAIQVETYFSVFVSDSVPALRTVHHTCAAKVVVHDDVLLRLKRLFVDVPYIYGLVACDLDLSTALDEVYQPTVCDIEVGLPSEDHLFINQNLLLLEKDDLKRRLDHNDLIVYVEHLLKGLIRHLSVNKLLWFVSVNNILLSVSVENVDLILL